MSLLSTGTVFGGENINVEGSLSEGKATVGIGIISAVRGLDFSPEEDSSSGGF